MNSSYSPVKAPDTWTWIDQKSWGGNCDSEIMQSPIPIQIDPTQDSLKQRFGFTYNFANEIPFVVKKNQDEVVIDFLTKGGDNGSLRMEFGQYEVYAKDFNPYRIEFKFPSEHTINGNRYDGDIVLMFNERIDNNDKVKLFLIYNTETCIN